MPSPTDPALSVLPVVLNTGARRGAEAARQLARLLADRPHEVVEVGTGAELLAALDRVVAARPGLVVVGGGDGTVAAAAQRLAGTDAVLGVLPSGTANDFTRTLQIPDLATAVEALRTGRVVDVDLGHVSALDPAGAPGPGRAGRGRGRSDGRTFLNVASCGLSSGVTDMLSPRLKRRLGPLAYPVATARAYRRHVDLDVTLEFPDGDHPRLDLEHVLQVSVGNGRHYGGGNTVAPAASVDDGTLDVSVIVRGSLRDHATWARGLRDGRVVEHDRVVHLTTRRVRLTTGEPLPLNLDGEPALVTPVELSVRRNALHVVVPQGSRAAAYDGPGGHAG